MKKVEFVQVVSEFSGLGLGRGNRYEFMGVEEIIRQRILDSWQYNGYVPLTTRGTGELETISLIFQKDE